MLYNQFQLFFKLDINNYPIHGTTLLFVLFCYLLLVTSAQDHLTFALYFGDNVLVDSGNALTFNKGQITTTEGANVYMVWVENDAIYFNSAQINGTKLGSSIVLSNNNTLSSFPQIAASINGTVYVVWVDKNNTSGDSNVMFRASNNYGMDFDPSVQVNKNATNLTSTPSLSTASSPQIAATENGSVYVVWVDKNNATGNSDVIFRGSNNSGKAFNLSVLLSKNPNQTSVTSSPQIAATEKGNVYVVWVDEKKMTGDSNIEFIRSNDSGKVFGNRIILRAGDHLSYAPQISTTEKGDVYVVWVHKDEETGDTDVSLRSSNDSGSNFGDRKRLRSNSLLSSSPQLTATEKGDVYVVWADKNSTSGDSDISFRSSNDSGSNFERAVNLNKGEKKLYNDSSPQMVTTVKDRVNVVWVNTHVEFKEISVRDALVGKTIILSNISAWSSSPQLTAIEKGDIYVAWTDRNNITDTSNTTDTSDTSLQFKKISEYFFDRNS